MVSVYYTRTDDKYPLKGTSNSSNVIKLMPRTGESFNACLIVTSRPVYRQDVMNEEGSITQLVKLSAEFFNYEADIDHGD